MEGMPYMGGAAAAAGPPFGVATAAAGPPFGTTDMFLSASALEGTASDPQAFQGNSASATGLYSMPVPGGDLNGFAYTASSSQGELGDMMGGLSSSAYGSHLPSSDDAFAHLDLESSTAKLGGVADGL